MFLDDTIAGCVAAAKSWDDAKRLSLSKVGDNPAVAMGQSAVSLAVKLMAALELGDRMPDELYRQMLAALQVKAGGNVAQAIQNLLQTAKADLAKVLQQLAQDWHDLPQDVTEGAVEAAERTVQELKDSINEIGQSFSAIAGHAY